MKPDFALYYRSYVGFFPHFDQLVFQLMNHIERNHFPIHIAAVEFLTDIKSATIDLKDGEIVLTGTSLSELKSFDSSEL